MNGSTRARRHGTARRSSHAGGSPAADRPDPVGLLEEQDPEPRAGPGAGQARPDDGLAVHFYRGAARIMAADLAGAPTADLGVQLRLGASTARPVLHHDHAAAMAGSARVGQTSVHLT